MKKMKDQYQGGFLMAKIRQVGGRISARILKESGVEINPAQGRIMFALWQNDGIPINELARKTQLGKSSLTSMLDRLEKMGYVRRERSPQDRRKVMIRRTNKDKSLEDVYVHVSQEMTEIYYRGFKKTEIEKFEQYLQRILDNLMEFESRMG